MVLSLCFAPQAVRVWRGFADRHLSRDTFLRHLREVFIPLTPQQQAPFGLTAYLPTILPADKPEGVPDEIALVFYRSREAYQGAKRATGGRAYNLLHAAVFDFARSTSDWPELLHGPPVPDRPYYLVDTPTDWFSGSSRVLVAARRPDEHADIFVDRVGRTTGMFKADGSPLDSIYFTCTADYLICWEHHPTPDYPFAAPSLIDELAQRGMVVMVATERKVPIPSSMHAVFPGLTLQDAAHLNLQFDRFSQGDDMPERNLKVYGLHGHAHGAPADTMESYWAALGSGAAGFIAGLQMTKDGTLLCAPADNLAATGSTRKIGEMTETECGTLHPGKEFRSIRLAEDNQATGERGADTPWHKVAYLRLPPLRHVLQVFGRRTEILLHCAEADEARLGEILDKTIALLTELGLAARVSLIGDKKSCISWREKQMPTPFVYAPGPGEPVAEGVDFALASGVTRILLHDDQLPGLDPERLKGVKVLVGSSGSCISTRTWQDVARLPGLHGIAVPAVDRGAALIRPPALVFADDFAGERIDRSLWTCGYSHNNRDTTISQDDGLIIAIREGGEYSGAAAVTLHPVHDDFDARVDFYVEAPQQATTFELAAIAIDPGRHHIDNGTLTGDKVNLTFDVHGAPPYASSERDEDNGFRIGWNNSYNITKVDAEWRADSVNMYNKYGRNVGNGSTDNRTGSLRLRRHGQVFTAFYKDAYNSEWVSSGSALVHNIGSDVFLRLAAKHWRKGGIPPANKVIFRRFRLYQF